MKTIFAVILSTLAAQAYAQSIEADLDGNASALQASEMRPVKAAQPKPDQKTEPQRIAKR